MDLKVDEKILFSIFLACGKLHLSAMSTKESIIVIEDEQFEEVVSLYVELFDNLIEFDAIKELIAGCIKISENATDLNLKWYVIESVEIHEAPIKLLTLSESGREKLKELIGTDKIDLALSEVPYLEQVQVFNHIKISRINDVLMLHFQRIADLCTMIEDSLEVSPIFSAFIIKMRS